MYEITYIGEEIEPDEINKPILSIDINSENSIKIIKSFDSCAEKLPSNIDTMTKDDVTKFFICKKAKTINEIALIYNCSKANVCKKTKELLDKYHIVYI